LYSEELFSRKVKKFTMTGKEEWTVEIGDETVTSKKDDEFLIKENHSINVINKN
jgi:hypothetical protein